MTDNEHEAEQLALADQALAATSEEALQQEPSDAPSSEPAAAPEPQPAAAEPPAAGEQQVPLAAFQELQRRLAETEAKLAPKPEPPDFFKNPDQYTDERIQRVVAPIVSQLQMVVANNNLAAARAIHGQELADKAYQEFDKELPRMSPYEAAAVMQAQNPFVAAVQWLQRREILKQVGDDPSTYRERLLQEALQDPDFLARAREALSAAGRQQPLPPRNEAGQFTAAPSRKPLPSVNRAGSAQQAMSAQPVPQDDMELADEILSMRSEPT